MGRVDIRQEAYLFQQTSAQIQRILDAVQFLNSSEVKELIELLKDIKNIDKTDDGQSIGTQLLNELEKKLYISDIQTELNDSAYPLQTKTVKNIVNSLNDMIETVDNKVDTSAATIEASINDKINTEATARQSTDISLSAQIEQLKKDTKLDDALSPYSSNGVKNKSITQAINDLKDVLYKKETVGGDFVIEVEPFTLPFTCISYGYNGAPTGAWRCDDLSDLYSSISLNGHSLEKHPFDAMAVNDIIVSDNYLEDDGWEICIDINLNPNDYDAYPVGSVRGYHTEEIFNYSRTYPYIANVTNSYIRVALGSVILPDDNVTVGGSIVNLGVGKGVLSGTTKIETLYTAPIIGDIDDLAVEADTLIDAINNISSNMTSGGVWHYGTALKHTANLGDSVTNNTIEGDVGDFYLNKNTFAVYFCVGDDKNNHNWLYIGNLTGSFDYSKYAALDSPNFTGIPTAPTPAVTNNSGQIATTEYVRDAIDKYGGSGTGGGVASWIIDDINNIKADVYGFSGDTYKIWIDNTLYNGTTQSFTKTADIATAPYNQYEFLINGNLFANKSYFKFYKNGVLQSVAYEQGLLPFSFVHTVNNSDGYEVMCATLDPDSCTITGFEAHRAVDECVTPSEAIWYHNGLIYIVFAVFVHYDGDYDKSNKTFNYSENIYTSSFTDGTHTSTMERTITGNEGDPNEITAMETENNSSVIAAINELVDEIVTLKEQVKRLQNG